MPSQRRAPSKRPPRPPTKKTSPSGAEPTEAATPESSAASDIRVPSTTTAVDDNGVESSTDDAVATDGTDTEAVANDLAGGRNGATLGETAGNGAHTADDAEGAAGAVDDEVVDEVVVTTADDPTPASAGAAATTAAATEAPRNPTATDKPRPVKTISPTSKALSSSNRPAGGAAKAANQPNGAKSASSGTAKKTPAAPTKSSGAGKSAPTTGKGGSSTTTTTKSSPSPRPKPSTSGPTYRPPTGKSRTASRQPPPKRKKKRFTKKTISAVVGLCLIAAIVVFFALAVNGSGTGSNASLGETGPENEPIPSGPVLAAAAAASYGPTIDGIQCQTSEQLAYHIHVHLTIFVNGKAQQIPYGIGIAPPVRTTTQNGGSFVDGGSCYYWLHTHAADGIVHIESPTSTIYTLGTFFDIWGQTLSADQVGPAQGKVTVYQNGKLYTGDPRQVQLTAHNQIQLDVGKNTPPQPLLSSWGSL